MFEKPNVNLLVAKSVRYFLYQTRVMQVQVQSNSVQNVTINLNRFPQEFSELFLADYSRKFV